MIKFKTNKIFIHIPKTSGTNFRNNVHISKKPHRYTDYNMCEDFSSEVLTDAGRELLPIIVLDPSRIAKASRYLIKHLPLSVWEEHEIYTDEKIYTLVRNPYTWLVSFYEETLDLMGIFYEFERPSLERFIFGERINILVDCFLINHKKTQLSYLKNLNGDVICEKYYKMEEDQDKIKKDFLLKDPEEIEVSPIPLITNRYNDNRREYNKDYASLFTDRLIEWTQETFREDFEYFSYDVNPFWK